ncbi:histone deacetylase 6 isoform X2 [Protopterus annectens]|uniref:histone deacetylase 6 isoform X2 n=1 Tax=Protopterus annectens TaxID=7888 RepID=UPI001CFA292C|nr:histone deacetylase 6 isoform X2 [Protopterus annectens]
MASFPQQSTRKNIRNSPRSPVSSTATSMKSGKKGGQQLRSQTLQEAKRKGRMDRSHGEEDVILKLQQMNLNGDSLTTETGLVYDERMTEFFCIWDKSFPECPERVTYVMEKIRQYGLLERCVQVQARAATEDELLLVHSQEYMELMKSTQYMSEPELKSLADTYDSVFLHPKFYECACLAVGSVLQLVDKVVSAEIQNGLAVVRPPGHHAYWEKMNGYSMFNNLAIAANYAKQNHGVERILIVDWDVHHGQSLQYIFEDDSSILYFSIHRYEHGEFWPHLPESDSQAVGIGRGEGYNINIPWNKIGMGDADYITAFLQVLMPVAYEFRPQLVLVAAGYDSAVGDIKGEMQASPSCFAILTHLLMSLAGGKVILSLEGGYNLQALAEGVSASLKILLGDPCPRLAVPFTPCQSALESICATIMAHRPYWKGLQNFSADKPVELEDGEAASAITKKEFAEVLQESVAEVFRKLPSERTALVYDERMKEHYNMWDSQHPELPQRISCIYAQHESQQLTEHCLRIPVRSATEEELQMCHSLKYIQTIKSTVDMKARDLHRQSDEYISIYLSPKTYDCALLATGSTFNVVEAILTGKAQNGVAIVRPPGHHAEKNMACGFCFFNTVALSARYAQKLMGYKMKVMILDWDIHHGNGTQHIFEDDPSVLYVSLHRYDHGLFFPSSEDANYDMVGRGEGEGFNINIPWSNGRMGNPEYISAFLRVVMPVAYEFGPELVLVSAGFDAAQGDPLGGYTVTPEAYAHMTHMLSSLAGGKVIVVLEGGYNLTSISESMSMCTWTLLGGTPPDLGRMKTPHLSAMQSISNVIGVHRKYWSSLRLQVTEPVAEDTPIQGVTPAQKTSPSPEVKSAEGKHRSSSELHMSPCTLSLPASPEQTIKQTDGSLTFHDLSGSSEQVVDDDSFHQMKLTHKSVMPTEVQTSEQISGDKEISDKIIASSVQIYVDQEHLQKSTVVQEPTEGIRATVELAKSLDSHKPAGQVTARMQSVGQRTEEQVPTDQLPVGQGSVEQIPGSQENVEQVTAHTVSVERLSAEVESITISELKSKEEKAREVSPNQSKTSTPFCMSESLSSVPVGGARQKVKSNASVSKESRIKAKEENEILPVAETEDKAVVSNPVFQEKTHQECNVNSAVSDPQEELLGEATGWSNVLRSVPFCQLFGNDVSLESGTLYAVTPLPWCPHLETVHPVPSSGLNVLQTCSDCGTERENWVCLVCYQVYCGRYVNEHMLMHGLSTGHLLVLSYTDLSVWCYGCESYVHNKVLFEVQNTAHRLKYGEHMAGFN